MGEESQVKGKPKSRSEKGKENKEEKQRLIRERKAKWGEGMAGKKGTNEKVKKY